MDQFNSSNGRTNKNFLQKVHFSKFYFESLGFNVLSQVKMYVIDVFTELSSGVVLLRLLEIISREKTAVPISSDNKFHKLANVENVFEFLRTKVVINYRFCEEMHLF